MSNYFEDLQAQVALTLSVEQGAVALIEGLADKIAATGFDPAQVAAVVQQLRDSRDNLAAAILENTPAAPAPADPAANPGDSGAGGAGGSQG